MIRERTPFKHQPDEVIKYIEPHIWGATASLGAVGKVLKAVYTVIGNAYWIQFKNHQEWLYEHQITNRKEYLEQHKNKKK